MDKRILQLDYSTLLRGFFDLLMPRVCAVCGRQLLACERHLCLECEADLPFTGFESVVHNPMADKFNALVEAPAYVRAAALFYYKAGYQNITQEVKYRRNFALGRWFGRMLGESLKGGFLGGAPLLVVPVPLHWTRRWQRGYNQSEIIAREVASALGARFEPRLLCRIRRTRTQTRLTASERSGNVAGAFAVSGRVARGQLAAFLPPEKAISFTSGAKPGPFAPDLPTILLIDDVFTTGATLAACYDALRSAFGPSVRICIATLAYVDNG